MKLPSLLRAAGYNVVTHFERYGNREGILDPQIIADCGKHKTILLTADSDLETTWAAEIESARIFVVILTNNTDGAEKWGKALEKGRQAILDHLRRYRKPCALKFDRNARVPRIRLYGKRRAKVIIL